MAGGRRWPNGRFCDCDDRSAVLHCPRDSSQDKHKLAVVSNNVVHSGLLGKNGRYHVPFSPSILRVGHRIHPTRRSSVGAGWEYVHVAVDDYSRAAYVEVLPDQTGQTAAGFLRRTVAWFARRGIAVSRVLTDNGSGYISQRFRASADRCRVRLTRTRPYRPQTNGKAERFIQTLIRGWAYAVSYPSSWRRTLALRPWLQHYNVVRPHAALGYQPPCVRFPRVAQ
jgi:transposase InsO family protein